MDRAGQKLLARARVAQEQDRGIRRADDGDLVHLVGGEIPPDLFFQVELLLRQLVPEQADLLVGQGIVQGDGDLDSHLLQQADDLALDGAFIPAAQGEDPKRPAKRNQGHAVEGADAFPYK